MSLNDGGAAAVARAKQFLADNPRSMLDEGVSIPHLLASDVIALHGMIAEAVREAYQRGWNEAEGAAEFTRSVLTELAKPEVAP